MATHFHLLGPVGATSDGTPLALGATKQRAVLAVLALAAGRTVTTDRLIDALWHEAPDTAPKIVQGYVSRLRKALEGSDAEIVTRGRGYELAADPESVDALRFARLAGEAAARDPAAAEAPVREALSLWRGAPLADLGDEPFVEAEVRRLEDLWLRAREIAVDVDLAAGREAAALAELESLLAASPLRERPHAQRMLALYRSGRQADALAAYATARRTLVEEIGVEPGRELQDLHAAVLRQDPALDLPRRRRPARPPVASGDTTAAAAAPAKRRRWPLALGAGLLGAAAILTLALAGRDDEQLPGIEENGVAVIAADGDAIEAEYGTGRSPVALAAGGGSVWTANQLDGTVTRIDADSGDSLSIEVGGEPGALAYGPESLWVADGAGATVAQVDPRRGRVVQRIEVGGGPRGLVVGAGSLWVVTALEGTVQRVPLDRGRVTQQVAVGGTPTAVAFGRDALWVTNETAGTLLRIDPRTGRALESVSVGNGPVAVAVGAGAVWTANRPDGTVSRVDPATGKVTDTLQVGGGPNAVAVVGDAVWTANSEQGSLTRIDARSRRVTDTVSVGSSPTALAPVGDAVWASALPAPSRHRGGTLRVRSRPPDVCFCADPVGYDGATWPAISVAYDGLVGYRRVAGAAGATLVGAVAVGVPRPSPDGRTYVFRLRRGVRYWDGSPVRAADVRASLERMLEINTTNIPPLYGALPGADECVEGKKPCDLSEAIEADEQARTVTFHLARPDPELPHKLALPLAAIVPSTTPRELVTGAPPPGTGPYRIVAFDAKRGARLERNRQFRAGDGRPDGFADAIEITYAPPDALQDIASVERGDTDLVRLDTGYTDPGARERVRGLITRQAGRLGVESQLNTEWMFMNVEEPPFDDLRVRQAVNFATDRARVVALAGGDEVARTSCQIVPPGVPGFAQLCPWTADPTPTGGWTEPDVRRARALVAASGTAGQRVTVWSPPPFEGVARYFASLLRRLGYRAGVKVVPEFPEYFATIGDTRNHVQMGATGWTADYVAPSSILVPSFSCRTLVPRSPENTNVSAFCDRRIDALIDRALARSATDPSGAASLWQEVDRRVVAAAPVVPLLNRRNPLLLSARTGNVQQHPYWGTLLDQVWLR